MAIGLIATCGRAVGAPTVDGRSFAIASADCRVGVRIVARNARTLDVMHALAGAYGFRLDLQTTLDGQLTFDGTVPYRDLVGRLLPDENVIVSRVRDATCQGGSRIARVWVLARPAAVAAVAASAGRGYRLPAAFLAVPVTPEAREQDELYQRAHGMMPPLAEPAVVASAPP